MASLNTDERGMKLAQYESCWKPVCCCISALEVIWRTKLSANAPDGAWTIGSAARQTQSSASTAHRTAIGSSGRMPVCCCRCPGGPR